MAELKMLAIDLGASSGRGIVGTFDGEKLTLRENHRFSNDPMFVNGRFTWDILRIYFEIKNSITKTVIDGDNITSMGIDTWGVDYGLIDKNGAMLREHVLHYLADWGEAAAAAWVEKDCEFCSTLVDRIVAGRPDAESAARYAQQLGEQDDVLVCGEPFHFFVVETPVGFDLESELPLKAAGVNVVYTPDMQPYRTRKVRFLNATHTTMVYRGLEKGFTEVAQCIADPEFNKFVRQVIFDEIFPTVNLPDAEKKEYAESVLERFANPFAHHQLKSIALNTIAKWKTRCLPVVCDYYGKFGKLPSAMIEGYEAIARHYDK